MTALPGLTELLSSGVSSIARSCRRPRPGERRTRFSGHAVSLASPRPRCAAAWTGAACCLLRAPWGGLAAGTARRAAGRVSSQCEQAAHRQRGNNNFLHFEGEDVGFFYYQKKSLLEIGR